MSLPTEQTVDDTIAWLVDNDLKLAQLKAGYSARKQGLKVTEAICLIAVKEYKNAPERSAMALTDPRYTKAIGELEQAECDKIVMELKFQRAADVIEVWRTLSANSRRTSKQI